MAFIEYLGYSPKAGPVGEKKPGKKPKEKKEVKKESKKVAKQEGKKKKG
jgi:hypothetical protein